MKPRVLSFARNALPGVLAGLGLALIALWAATENRTRLMSWEHDGFGYVLRADAGRVCFERFRFDAKLTAVQGGWSYRLASGVNDNLVIIPQNRTLRNGYGFEWFDARFVMDGLAASFTRVAVPFWPVVALCAAPALVRLARSAARRRRQRHAGRCVRCNYDLRATPEGGGAMLERCPECGTASKAA